MGRLPPWRGLSRRSQRIAVDIVVLAALALSYLLIPVPGGHVGVGYAAAVAALAHLAQYWPAFRRGVHERGPLRRRAVSDGILFLLIAATVASGLWQQFDDAAARPWHSTVGTAALLLALGHGWRRRHAMRPVRRGSPPDLRRGDRDRCNRPAARR
jgi:peptidoglycan biosynthesis protein MviN/MurJ (putative lipid II flippase)